MKNVIISVTNFTMIMIPLLVVMNLVFFDFNALANALQAYFMVLPGVVVYRYTFERSLAA